MTEPETPPRCLENRAILVTGAGDGLGRAASLAFARHGAEVILLGRTVSKLEAVYDEIVALGAPTPAVYPMDLAGASVRDFQDVAGTIGARIGHLEGLLHSAAALELLTPLAFHPPEDWERTLRVNLTAPFLLTQACLPLLKAAGRGTVIFTTDECAIQPKGYWGAYGASKAALNNLAFMWAKELSDTQMRVHVLDPGPARTGMRLRTHPGAPLSAWPLPDALMPVYVQLMNPDTPVTDQVVSAAEWLTGDSQAEARTGTASAP